MTCTKVSSVMSPSDSAMQASSARSSQPDQYVPGRDATAVDDRLFLVITSYSIHYTKLYDEEIVQ